MTSTNILSSQNEATTRFYLQYWSIQAMNLLRSSLFVNLFCRSVALFRIWINIAVICFDLQATTFPVSVLFSFYRNRLEHFDSLLIFIFISKLLTKFEYVLLVSSSKDNVKRIISLRNRNLDGIKLRNIHFNAHFHFVIFIGYVKLLGTIWIQNIYESPNYFLSRYIFCLYDIL